MTDKLKAIFDIVIKAHDTLYKEDKENFESNFRNWLWKHYMIYNQGVADDFIDFYTTFYHVFDTHWYVKDNNYIIWAKPYDNDTAPSELYIHKRVVEQFNYYVKKMEHDLALRELKNKLNQPPIIKLREYSTAICDLFEELLEQHDITIPDEDREGNEDEARLYGMTYAHLEEDVLFLLKEFAIKVRETPNANIDDENL